MITSFQKSNKKEKDEKQFKTVTKKIQENKIVNE